MGDRFFRAGAAVKWPRDAIGPKSGWHFLKRPFRRPVTELNQPAITNASKKRVVPFERRSAGSWGAPSAIAARSAIAGRQDTRQTTEGGCVMVIFPNAPKSCGANHLKFPRELRDFSRREIGGSGGNP
jgi:hypothetical protein